MPVAAINPELDAERTILGAILLDNDAWAEAASLLSPSDFHLDAHKRLFTRMGQVIDNGQCDIVTLSEALGQTGELSSVGGVAWIASLTEQLPRRLAIGDYCRIVKEHSRLRSIGSVCETIGARCDGTEKSSDLIAAVQDGLESVLAGEDEDASVRSFTVAALDRFQTERKLEQSPGLSYGIPALDNFTGGMRKGEVTVVGARSGVGKTSLMCQAAAANCRAGVPVTLFSLEMTREQILRRLWSIESQVPYKRITDPWLSNVTEAQLVSETAFRVAEWPLRIYDREDLNLGKILAIARICIRRHGTRLMVVDYAQEVDAPGKDERSKVMLVCRRLTRLVKHEDCSLMLLSQLTKQRREDYGKPPVVGDLIESGKLENVAHVVVLLHRGWDEERRRIADDAELHIPKQRRGETGVLQARFSRITAMFEEA
jgi:replicative DNA helicase